MGLLDCRASVKNVTLFPANEQVKSQVKVMCSDDSVALSMQSPAWWRCRVVLMASKNFSIYGMPEL